MSFVIDLILTDADVLDWSFDQPVTDVVEILEIQGITAGTSGNSAVYSRSPSTAPARGRNYIVQANVSPDDQTAANVEAGYRYALEQGIFQDADGIMHRGGELMLTCPGQYNVLDFAGAYIQFSYEGRRVDFTEYLFYLKTYTYELDADTLTSVTKFRFQVATAALPGETYSPP